MVNPPLSTLLAIATMALFTSQRAIAQEPSPKRESSDKQPATTESADQAPTAALAPIVLTPFEATEGFSVLMPKDPKVKRDKKWLPFVGTFFAISVKAKASDVAFIVARILFPPKALDADGEREILSTAAATQAKSNDGKVVKESAVSIPGGKAIDFTIASAKGMTTCRVAVLGNSQYSLCVAYTGSVPAEASLFFDSLKITGSK